MPTGIAPQTMSCKVQIRTGFPISRWPYGCSDDFSPPARYTRSGGFLYLRVVEKLGVLVFVDTRIGDAEAKRGRMGPAVGIDVGENSVGLASIECDESGMPMRIQRLMVVIHDNGKDGMASGQSGTVSRKASRGTARRVRRLLRNRRRRAVGLARLLAERGYPIVDAAELSTYEQWDARSLLLAGFIDEEQTRRRLISLAIRHMSNHRGWVNAWVPIDSYVWKETPSEEFNAAVEAVVEADRFGDVDPAGLRYQADLAALGLANFERLRPRNPSRPRPDAVTTAHLLGQQRRVDVVREWRQICRVQRVADEEFLEFARLAFGQEKPKVPLENVGFDWLPGFEGARRASIASLEHQEFQIRQTVANVAVRERPFSKERMRLDADQQNLIVDHLMGVTKKEEAPTWRDVAELFLGVAPNLLVHVDPEQSLNGVAPIMRSVASVHELPKKHPVFLWWEEATTDRRSEFILWLADPAKVKIAEASEAEFSALFEGLDEKQSDAVLKLKFPSGRSAHSLEALRKLSAEMERSGDGYTTSRNRLFNGGEDMRPKDLLSLDTEADHPTLQRILPIVRRFLLAVDRQPAGPPSRVVIEHVRSAFLGFTAKQEAAREQGKNRRDRERAQQEIADAGLGISNASDSMIKKFQAIQRQGSMCLYCGGTLVWSATEMDHIVPRASGGNSTRANLVAVCRDCNEAKGRDPFRVFAESGRRAGVSIDGALARVASLQMGEIRGKAAFRMKADMRRRLQQTENDDPIDERSLASTAYAAVDMVRRIDTHYGSESGKIAKAYSGRIVQAARRASGIDKRIHIREGIDVKSRFDRRHHAIDAAVAAMLDPSVARTLAERDDLRRAALDTDFSEDWKRYEGSGPQAVEKFRAWKDRMARLAELVQAELDRDDVVVMQPVRFSGRHAALHEEGRAAHGWRLLGEEWTSADRARIADDRIYALISDQHAPSEDLPADPRRTIRLPNGKWLEAEDKIFVFPDTAARTPLPHQSSAKLGQSIHHMRLYRWVDLKGRLQAGVVRVWAADLYDLEGGIGSDLLTAELPETSRAVRRATNLRLRDAIHDGIAEHVGTLVVGDEVSLNPREWAGGGKVGEFLAEFPETHWRISGFEDDARLNMKPLYLSSEGAQLAGTEAPDPRKVRVSPVVYEALEKKPLRFAIGKFTSTPSTRIIRRTATGSVRWREGTGMPSSWCPYEALRGE